MALGAASSKIEDESRSPRLGMLSSGPGGFCLRRLGFEGSRDSLAGFFRPRKRSSIVRRVATLRVMEGRRWWGWGWKGLKAVARRE